MARQLRRAPLFLAVNNGEAAIETHDREFLFNHRYLLSQAVTPQHFSVTALTSAIDDTIALLASPAGLLAKSLLTQDPTGEMLQIVSQLEAAADRTALTACGPPRRSAGVVARIDARRRVGH